MIDYCQYSNQALHLVPHQEFDLERLACAYNSLANANQELLAARGLSKYLKVYGKSPESALRRLQADRSAGEYHRSSFAVINDAEQITGGAVVVDSIDFRRTGVAGSIGRYLSIGGLALPGPFIHAWCDTDAGIWSAYADLRTIVEQAHGSTVPGEVQMWTIEPVPMGSEEGLTNVPAQDEITHRLAAVGQALAIAGLSARTENTYFINTDGSPEIPYVSGRLFTINSEV